MNPPPALIALSPGGLTESELPSFREAVRAATEAGLPGLLLRETLLSDAALFALARDVSAPWLAIHDRVHVARAVSAQAVHLGFRSLGTREARRAGSESLSIGLSTHAADESSEWEGADYLFHGPVRDTPSKRGLQDPIGWSGFREAVEPVTVPVLAIGGLEPTDAPQARAAGASGMAVLRGILGAEDPGREASRYLEAWGE